VAGRSRAGVRLLSNRSARAGLAVVAGLVAFALLGPLLAKHGPLESDFAAGIAPDGSPVGPSAAFPLGADRLFRDQLARLAYAGRLSLLIAVSATLLASVIGATIGITAGWYEGTRPRVPWPALAGLGAAAAGLATGRPLLAAVAIGAGLVAAVAGAGRHGGARIDVDGWLMRLADVMLAFPFLLLVMAIGAALEKTTATTIFVTLGATGWLGVARVLRAKTLQVRSLDFVEAARALGQSTPFVLLKHVLPNVAGPLVVTATIQVAQMIVADSALSYLGVGISPPAPTWGRMLFEGQDDYLSAPWLVVAPGLVILLAVWGFNMLGEGLRDALDPRGA
jgi:ABC-type dipeptide/oligopeptide/nickel transport system permease subunit